MRLFKVLAPLACLYSVCLLADPRVKPASHSPAVARAMPGPMETLRAAKGDRNYSYGPTGPALSRLTAHARAHAVTANITVIYDANFNANPAAKAAFQAAVNIWARTVVSPAPIRVKASFVDLGPGILGGAGPSTICTADNGLPDTWYAAALADKLDGAAFCAALGPADWEIEADLNSAFTSWDYGTTGTGVSGRYNFMTVVLHELGHGLGFYGSMSATGGEGSFGYGSGWPDIFDRFAFTGGGARLIDFPNPSMALGSQLVSNDTFFDGPNTRSVNGGAKAKLETHDFTAFYGLDSDNGFSQGSSYSHLDDDLYTGTPNGLMTFALNSAEVFTDPGPIMRGMFQDEGWTLEPPPCSAVLSPASLTTSFHAASSSVTVTAGTGCAWTATSDAAFLTITGATSGSGNGAVTFNVAANISTMSRTGNLTIAGHTFTVTQTGVATKGDFDGDGAADLILFRPGNGDWMMRLSSQGFATGPDLSFGLSTDKPVPGDYDGDGLLDMALYRPSNGTWYVIFSSTSALAQLQWGIDTDIPMPADYTGDGRTDLCVWRPSTGVWYIFDLSNGTFTGRQWGLSTDTPLTGDYDGDGLADVAVFRPSNGNWYVFFSSTQTYTVYQWGVSTDLPLPADYTGDGRLDIAVYRPSNGNWYVYDLSTNTFIVYQWGISTDIPAPKDYDGDGRTDLAIWRPSTGTWFIYFLGSNTFQSVVHGVNGDAPIK